jgi:predicted esterase
MTQPTIHENQPVERRGADLDDARAAMILVHGRGGGTESILPLLTHLEREGVAYLAPRAAGNTWYPHRFIAPRESNEPKLSSALAHLDSLIDDINNAGIPTDKIMLLGFSQGACLSLEYAARHPQRFGGVVGFSGGLIGAEGELTGYEGSLDNTPVFIGCSDVDAHIPIERVHESASILDDMGAEVDKRIYPGMGHTINTDEVEAVQGMLDSLLLDTE